MGHRSMSITLEQEREELMELGEAPASPTRQVWRQMRRNPLAMASLVVLTLIVLLAVFYPIVSPYRYDHQTERLQRALVGPALAGDRRLGL